MGIFCSEPWWILSFHKYIDKTSRMIKRSISILVALLLLCGLCVAQNVPILNFGVNNLGQVELEIDAQADQYYLLSVLHGPDMNYETITSITMGVDGSMIISEPLGAFELPNYKITKHSIDSPDDTDGDGIDDISEFNDMPTQSPLNFATKITFEDGTTAINSPETYTELAVVYEDISWAPFLNNQEFTKFIIFDHDTDNPRVYFINSKTHFIHQDFKDAIGASIEPDVSGEIVFNPNEVLSNGVTGSYSFNYSFGEALSFSTTRRTFELLAANMPFLQNNFKHFIGDIGEGIYETLYQDDFVGSRIPVVLESELFADVDYLPFNQAEGFGFFRVMELDENPGSRDIVLYNALPNSLPRVGGIITSVIQTPLSHVNLRAIQDNVPNAFIRDPLEIDLISDLVGKYIYYKVEQDNYTIREASLDEVNEWYEKLRPTEPQIPQRDLEQTKILPLDSIKFVMSDAFGAKCTNVATLRTFGFPEGTIPDGFGVPFYFYDEFMKFNGFYDAVAEMISDPDFIADLETRIDMLKEFRKTIKRADMPQWMLDELQVMHDQFPAGSSVRCRSSTNNEDLPGFSGAGLYTSKTQHPEEGHISKSIKQLYASMWNFRAYDERDFYRVDHYIAAMGVLCHPNFKDEKSNGVGVSIDPIYQTENTFYLNTQVGESLITNPDANAIPEEILLNEDPEQGYSILRRSNLVHNGELVMGEEYLDLMRTYLKVIHDEFAILYNVVGAEGFGMDIEYKVTSADQLIIKQARPWVSFWSDINANFDLAVIAVKYPQNSATLGDAELVTVEIANRGLENMKDFEVSLSIDDLEVETIVVSEVLTPQISAEYQFAIPQDFSTIGDYNIAVVVSHPSDGYEANDSLNMVLSKLHVLEGGVTIVKSRVICDDKVEVVARVTNYGEITFTETELEVVVNGSVLPTINYDFNIPYSVEADISITISDNLQQEDNDITVNLVRVNGEQDAVSDNNSDSVNTDLESSYDDVMVVINPDDYSEEISWQVYDVFSNEIVGSGSLAEGITAFSENVCVDYSSCFSLLIFDLFGDGLCCQWGSGDFLVINASGDTLATHDGNFESQAEIFFCPNGEGCSFTAGVSTTDASEEFASDGTITIIPTEGFDPYEYSIDGGQSFIEDNIFDNLVPGSYTIVVRDASETCFYEETIELEFEVLDNTEDASLGIIRVFPNPTEGNLTIEINEAFIVSGDLKIDIYNSLGKLIKRESISKSDNGLRTVISLGGYPMGTYTAKCYNHSVEKNFMVVKI